MDISGRGPNQILADAKTTLGGEMPLQITKTYDLIDGHMQHDGYFIYGDSRPIAWVSLENCKPVYQ